MFFKELEESLALHVRTMEYILLIMSALLGYGFTQYYSALIYALI